MAFVYVTITHTYETADDIPADGYVEFCPVYPMRDGNVTVPAAPQRADLNAAGTISQKLAANTGPDTRPTGTTYKVTERITGQAPVTYFVQVPHDQGAALDLRSLSGWVGGIIDPDLAGIQTINGEAPDIAGELALSAGDVGAQPADGDLTGLAGLGDGYPRRDAGTWQARTASEFRGDIGAQASDADLTALAALSDGVPVRTGGTWAAQDPGTFGGVSDHGALTGLADDDHPQYHNNTRGDARYSQLGHNHSGTYAELVHTHAQSDVTGLATALAGKVDVALAFGTTRTGNYSIVSADVDVMQTYDSASSGTFTLPTNTSQAIAVGRKIPFRQANTGQLTIAAAGGVTLQARGSAFKLAGQHAVAEALKIATDTWVLYGDITT